MLTISFLLTESAYRTVWRVGEGVRRWGKQEGTPMWTMPRPALIFGRKRGERCCSWRLEGEGRREGVPHMAVIAGEEHLPFLPQRQVKRQASSALQCYLGREAKERWLSVWCSFASLHTECTQNWRCSFASLPCHARPLLRQTALFLLDLSHRELLCTCGPSKVGREDLSISSLQSHANAATMKRPRTDNHLPFTHTSVAGDAAASLVVFLIFCRYWRSE